MHPALFAVAHLALAQSIDINVNPFGGRVDVRPPPGESKAVVTEDVSADGYRLAYRTSEDGYTVLEVLEPEGVRVDIWDGTFSVASDDAPMSFHAKSNQWYRVVLTSPNGQSWERKIQAKGGMRGSLRVVAPVYRSAVAVAAAPSTQALSEGDFERLKSAIEAESFSKQKLDVLRTAARASWFTVHQVGELVDLFSFGNDKVESVAAVAGRIVDRGSAFELYEHFTFSSDKEKVKAVLARY
jgi:hypothetical protein